MKLSRKTMKRQHSHVKRNNISFAISRTVNMHCCAYFLHGKVKCSKFRTSVCPLFYCFSKGKSRDTCLDGIDNSVIITVIALPAQTEKGSNLSLYYCLWQRSMMITGCGWFLQ